MATLLKGFLNLSKCKNPEYLKQTKAGDVGVWVNIWLNDEPDQYGNTLSIQLNQSKEQREAGVKKVYICNAKPNEAAQNVAPQTESDTTSAEKVNISDLPW